MFNMRVHLKRNPGGAFLFSINLYIPAGGDGPFPILLGSDMSWSPLADNWQPGPGENASIGGANLQTLVSRGYIMAEFGRDDFSLDYADDGGAAVFNSRIYRFYPGYDWGMLRRGLGDLVGWSTILKLSAMSTQPKSRSQDTREARSQPCWLPHSMSGLLSLVQTSRA